MIGFTFQEFDMDPRQAQVFRQSIKNSEHLETSYEQEALAPTKRTRYQHISGLYNVSPFQ